MSVRGIGRCRARPSSSPAPSVAVTWDAAYKDAGLTLSGGNLTVTSTVANTEKQVRSTTSHSSGKWWVEHTLGLDAADDWQMIGFGFCTPAFDILDPSNDVWLGADANSIGIYPFDAVYIGGVVVASLSDDVSGPKTVYIDIPNGKGWIRTLDGNYLAGSGGGGGDPATGANPTFTFTPGLDLFVALTFFASGKSWTTNFGATAAAQAVPTGFGPWQS